MPEPEALDAGAETAMGAPRLPSVKWPKLKDWGIGEWGSVASMLGVGLWAFDHFSKKFKRKRT